ncbi:MAG: LysR family transcriptional regulator [Acidimicrobiaceae bacterium]|nr:LysR family transcriptional regulator [Acidimicrobiaceae bacterium]
MAQPTVVQLRAFVTVAREGHFGDAADELGISQPAVSAALRALEANLGGEVVERTPRGTLLTTFGRALLPSAERVLAALDELGADAARAGRPHHGPLRLGVIPTVAPYVLPTLLTTISSDFPELQPEVREQQTAALLTSLAEGSLDVAVLALPSEDSSLRELPLYWEEFVLLVPGDSPVAGARRLPLSTLSGLEVLLLEEGHCLRDQTMDVCRQAGAVGQTARATSLTTLSQLVAAHLGVTLLPATAVPVEVRGSLATASFAGTKPSAVLGGNAGRLLPGRRIGLVHRASSGRAAEHEELAEALRVGIAAAGLPVTVVGSAS